MRLNHWVKNLFVFLPIIFGGGLLAPSKISAALISFLCFSLISSSIYIFNDLFDREADRQHKVKCTRPIAAGLVSVKTAILLMIILLSLSVGLSFALFKSYSVAAVILSYFVLNVAYTIWLKHLAIIDVMIIAIGFDLRVFAGGFACDISISPWLAVMVFLLTLFIAFGKRRDDMIHNPERRSVSGYTQVFIDIVMAVLSSTLFITYLIYTLSPEVETRFHSSYVYLTSIFVIAGMLRYLQLALVHKNTGDPAILAYRDPFLLACALLWLGSFGFIIYC